MLKNTQDLAKFGLLQSLGTLAADTTEEVVTSAFRKNKNNNNLSKKNQNPKLLKAKKNQSLSFSRLSSNANFGIGSVLNRVGSKLAKIGGGARELAQPRVQMGVRAEGQRLLGGIKTPSPLPARSTAGLSQNLTTVGKTPQQTYKTLSQARKANSVTKDIADRKKRFGLFSRSSRLAQFRKDAKPMSRGIMPDILEGAGHGAAAGLVTASILGLRRKSAGKAIKGLSAQLNHQYRHIGSHTLIGAGVGAGFYGAEKLRNNLGNKK